MALVDADYKFRWVDVGANESCSYCQIFHESDLKEYVEDDILHLSTAQHLEIDDCDTHFCIIGDYFFPLCTWFMKAYNINKESMITTRRSSSIASPEPGV
jgi:hypothetical protein